MCGETVSRKATTGVPVFVDRSAEECGKFGMKLVKLDSSSLSQ